MGVRKKNLLTAGLVVTLVVGGWWVHAKAQIQGAQTGPPAYATIVFSTSNGNCVKQIVTTGGNKVHAKRNSVVRWTVSNNCAVGVDVSLQDFKPSSPFSKAPNSCTAAPGDTCRIEGVISEKAEWRTYKYSVYDGKTKKDPDLIIDP